MSTNDKILPGGVPSTVPRAVPGAIAGAVIGAAIGAVWAARVPGADAAAVALSSMHLITGTAAGAVGAWLRRNRSMASAVLFAVAAGSFVGFAVGFPIAMGAVMLRPPNLTVHGEISLGGAFCLVTGCLAGAIAAIVTRGPAAGELPPRES